MDNKTKLADLREELEAIRFANNLYLDHCAPSVEATAEYRRRLERLQQVGKKMKELEEKP